MLPPDFCDKSLHFMSLESSEFSVQRSAESSQPSKCEARSGGGSVSGGGKAPLSIEVLNFGCRLNAYESQVMKNHAEAAGLHNTILVNTCAVTKEAERQAKQAIRKAKREHPDAQIIVSGCSAQIDPQKYAAMPEVSRVLGNEEKLKADSYLPLPMGEVSEHRELGEGPHPSRTLSLPTSPSGRGEKVYVNDIMSVTETASHLVEGLEGKARAFIQVQNGCNHRCTFCIIPYGRGNSRSVPMGEVVSQVRQLVVNGYREVVLTGVDISDYGSDLPGKPTLGQMMRRLLAAVPELPRLRVSSIDAVEMDEDFFRLLAEEPRLMPHLHLSLQAGDDMILKRMKRRHLRHHALEFAARVQTLRPDVVFGADIITGFPTETEGMFQNTLDLARQMNLVYLHVFPYSERPGTPAAKMPPVAKNIRKERAARLRAVGEENHQRFLQSQLGKTVSILMEKPTEGRTEHFAMVQLQEPQEVGSIITAQITHQQGEMLCASVTE